jgi:hypothetical protein
MKSPLKFAAVHALSLSVGALFATSALAALADGEEPKQELSESAVRLPAAPAKDKLLRYYVSPTATMEFAVDPKSVSVSDRVIVRFTSVITSPSGATNVSHEGIRCDTLERRLYATGRPDGSWAPASSDAWRPIGNVGANRYQAALAQDYFCDAETVAGKAETIVERLRRQKPLPRPGEYK